MGLDTTGSSRAIKQRRPISTPSDAMTIISDRIRKRIGGIGRPFRQRQPLGANTSRILTNTDSPGRRPTETNPAPPSVSRPREAENPERPNSAQSSNASSKLTAVDGFPCHSYPTLPLAPRFGGCSNASSSSLNLIIDSSHHHIWTATPVRKSRLYSSNSGTLN
jgi:hypothetical protein